MTKNDFETRLKKLFPDINDFGISWEIFDFDTWLITPQPALNGLSPDQCLANGQEKALDGLVFRMEAEQKKQRLRGVAPHARK